MQGPSGNHALMLGGKHKSTHAYREMIHVKLFWLNASIWHNLIASILLFYGEILFHYFPFSI